MFSILPLGLKSLKYLLLLFLIKILLISELEIKGHL